MSINSDSSFKSAQFHCSNVSTLIDEIQNLPPADKTLLQTAIQALDNISEDLVEEAASITDEHAIRLKSQSLSNMLLPSHVQHLIVMASEKYVEIVIAAILSRRDAQLQAIENLKLLRGDPCIYVRLVVDTFAVICLTTVLAAVPERTVPLTSSSEVIENMIVHYMRILPVDVKALPIPSHIENFQFTDTSTCCLRLLDSPPTNATILWLISHAASLYCMKSIQNRGSHMCGRILQDAYTLAIPELMFRLQQLQFLRFDLSSSSGVSDAVSTLSQLGTILQTARKSRIKRTVCDVLFRIIHGSSGSPSVVRLNDSILGISKQPNNYNTQLVDNRDADTSHCLKPACNRSDLDKSINYSAWDASLSEIVNHLGLWASRARKNTSWGLEARAALLSCTSPKLLLDQYLPICSQLIGLFHETRETEGWNKQKDRASDKFPIGLVTCDDPADKNRTGVGVKTRILTCFSILIARLISPIFFSALTPSSTRSNSVSQAQILSQLKTSLLGLLFPTNPDDVTPCVGTEVLLASSTVNSARNLVNRVRRHSRRNFEFPHTLVVQQCVVGLILTVSTYKLDFAVQNLIIPLLRTNNFVDNGDSYNPHYYSEKTQRHQLPTCQQDVAIVSLCEILRPGWFHRLLIQSRIYTYNSHISQYIPSIDEFKSPLTSIAFLCSTYNPKNDQIQYRDLFWSSCLSWIADYSSIPIAMHYSSEWSSRYSGMLLYSKTLSEVLGGFFSILESNINTSSKNHVSLGNFFFSFLLLFE